MFSKLLYKFCGALKTKGAPAHTKSLHLSSPLPLNMSRWYTYQVFFNPVTPSRIITSDIFKSPQVRFIIVWSSLNYFSVQQSMVTNYMHFHSTHIPHYSTPSWIEAVGCFCGGAPPWMLDRILNATLTNNLLLLSHPWFTPTQRSHFLQ